MSSFLPMLMCLSVVANLLMTPVLFPAIVSSVNIGYSYLRGQRTAVTNHVFYRIAYVRLGRTNHKPFTPSTVMHGT